MKKAKSRGVSVTKLHEGGEPNTLRITLYSYIVAKIEDNVQISTALDQFITSFKPNMTKESLRSLYYRTKEQMTNG